MRKTPDSALRIARQWRGFTLVQLQDASGVSTGRLSMMERGMVQPKEGERVRLAAALQQPVDAIFPAPRRAELDEAPT